MSDQTINKASRYLRVTAIYFLLTSSLLLVSILSALKGSLFQHLISVAELLSVLFVFSLLLRKLPLSLSFFITAFLHFFYLILIQYYLTTKIDLNAALLSRNIGNIGPIISGYIYIFTLYALISLLNAYALANISARNFLYKKYITALAIVLAVISFLGPLGIPGNRLSSFALSFFQKNSIHNYYNDFYDIELKRSTQAKKKVLNEVRALRDKEQPAYLDNIIFLQLESLNSILVNKKNTPNLMNLADKGVFFPEFYSNGVHTLLGQENILCSLPNSLDFNLVQSGRDKDVLCLPAIFKELGYKNFFLKSYSLEFTRTGEFMKNIGFEEIHADGIMDEDDPKTKWGYREDIFYQKAFDLFEQRKEKKNFLYIEIGPTNHWPFVVPERFSGLVPNPEPKTAKEKLANTTFIQDHYFKGALERINQIFPDNNYTLFIISDHSWPIGLHPDNLFNQSGNYEENFLSSMVMQIGGENIYQDKIVKTRYSNMDILPSLMDIAGIDPVNSPYSRSFFSELEEEIIENNKTILIQPYTNRKINIIENGKKYIYDDLINRLLLYDLAKDPLETNPMTIGLNTKDNLKKIKELLPWLKNDHIIMHALGGIDGAVYTNSLEAFTRNRERGRRIFELDLALSLDNELLVSHDDPALLKQKTLAEFLSNKPQGRYTPLSFNDILELMDKYKDTALILDVKSNFKDTYSKIIQAALDHDEALLERMVPQIYFENQLDLLEGLYPFKELIYTLYRTDSSDEAVLKFVRENEKISMLAMFEKRFSADFAEKLRKENKKIFVHTINCEKTIKELIMSGADGIYSDFY